MEIGNKNVNLYFAFIMALLCFCTVIKGVTPKRIVPPGGVDKERLMTREEKLAFDKFKKRVQPYLIREDLKNDLFLLRWLRAKNFNVDVAIEDAKGLLNFYYDNKIENITDEDMGDFEHDFPFHLDAFDREGRPVGYVHLREGWDIRAAMLQGKRKRMERYFIKEVFELMLKVRDVNKVNPNVTQFVVLFNLDGFSLIQQGCPVCLQSIISLLTIYERYLPGFSYEIVIVEAPTTFKVFFQAIRPALSSHTREAMKFFDTNKNQWMAYLHSRIDPSQLPPYFGGTKREGKHMK